MSSKIEWQKLSNEEVQTLSAALKVNRGPSAASLASEGHRELVRRGLFHEIANDVADAIVIKDSHADVDMARAIELLKAKGRLDRKPLEISQYQRLQQDVQESVQRVHPAVTSFRLCGFKIPHDQRVATSESSGPSVVVE